VREERPVALPAVDRGRLLEERARPRVLAARPGEEAEVVQGLRDARRVAAAPADPERPLDERLRLVELPLARGEHPRVDERARERRRPARRSRDRRGEPAPPLGEMTAHLPEAAEGGRE